MSTLNNVLTPPLQDVNNYIYDRFFKDSVLDMKEYVDMVAKSQFVNPEYICVGVGYKDSSNKSLTLYVNNPITGEFLKQYDDRFEHPRIQSRKLDYAINEHKFFLTYPVLCQLVDEYMLQVKVN